MLPAWSTCRDAISSLLALEWLQEGLPADFPCAIVSHAAQPGQQVQRTTLGELGEGQANRVAQPADRRVGCSRTRQTIAFAKPPDQL